MLVIGLLGGTCGGPDLTDPVIEDPGEQVLDYQPNRPPTNLVDTDPGLTPMQVPQLVVQASVAEGVAPLDVLFTANTSDGSALPSGTYTWDFGDGTTGEGQQVGHTYSQAAVYTVNFTLTAVVSGVAYQDAATTTVSVSAARPQQPAGVSAQYEVTEGEALQFVLQASAADGNTRFTVVTPPSYGALDVPSGVGLESPVVTYTAPADFNGEVSFTFAAYDITKVTAQAVLPAQMATVRVTVFRKGVLSVTPAGALSAAGNVGGPFTPLGVAYTLTNTGGRAISWSATKTQSWTTLSSVSGTLEAGASAIVAISINAAANTLAGGGYNDLVAFTNTTSGYGNTTRAVNLSVKAAPGALSVSPASGLTATGNQGGPFAPSSQLYTLTNSGSQPINWAATKAQAWVTLSKASGTLAAGAKDTVTVSINSSANTLAAGGYSDSVAFTNTTNGSGNTTRSVGLTVAAVAGMLSVSPTSGFASTGYRGGPFAPASATYTLSNTGGQTFNWSAAKTQNWATLSKNSGTLAAGASDTVTVTINSAANALAAGTYADTLAFTNSTTGSGNTTRGLSLTVNATQGALSVSATSGLTSTGTAGGPFAPASAVYTLSNTGGQPFNWTVAKAQTWMTLSKASGTLAAGASDTVTVSINSGANSLAVGNYTDTVIFSNTTTGSGNTTRSVNLAVTAVPGALAVSSANGLISAGSQDGTFAPASLAYTLSNTGGQPLNWTAAKTQSWVTVSKASGTLAVGASDTVTIALNTAVNTLGGGTFTDTVTFTNATSGSGNTTRSVTLHIVPALTIGASTNGGDVPLAVQYTALEGGVTASHLPTGSTLNWNFGDATPVSNGVQVNHTFTTAGTYWIALSLVLPGGLGTVACAQTTTQATQPGSPDGPVISGQLTLLPTAGYRPPIGQQDLLFTGTGASAGVNYTATTDVQGYYSRAVPTGWTGTITPANNRLIFLDPTTYSAYQANGALYAVAITTPITNPTTKNLAVWTAPIGVPAPSFGIRESHWMYVGKTYDFGSGPVAYPDAGNGPYTYYVDNTDAAATDTSNAYGTPAKPRKTLPRYLKAGDVVEVHGGPYTPSADRFYLQGEGTASAPIFVRGVGTTSAPVLTRKIHLIAQYLVVEKFALSACSVDIRPLSGADVHHIAVRRMELIGSNTFKEACTVGVTSDSALHPVHDIVLNNNYIHDNGQYDAASEDDTSAFSVQLNSASVWILDNLAHHSGGDGTIIAHNANFSTAHVYLGRNVFHHHRENAVDIKQCEDVIVSQNRFHSYAPTSSSLGEAAVVHYDSRRVWFLANEISDAQYGISSSGAVGLYALNNVIYDIREIAPASTGPESVYRGGIAIRFYASSGLGIANNSISGCVSGIGLSLGSAPTTIVNNIVTANDPLSSGYHLIVTGDAAVRASCQVDGNLFFQDPGAVRIWWGSVPYDLRTFSAAAGKCASCLSGDPAFQLTTPGDFHIPSTSVAKDHGVANTLYQDFQGAYGIDIHVDADGRRRPVATVDDVGAYEVP